MPSLNVVSPSPPLSLGLTEIERCPDGADSLFLMAQCATAPHPILMVARDDARMARLASNLAFFAPHLSVAQFPAWDCLPYDRVSPQSENMATRLATLSQLSAKTPLDLVITTVNGLCQYVPPRHIMAQNALTICAGKPISLDHLTAYFSQNGYYHTGTVREAGEFAMRGGIIDIFPAGHANPVRLDLFGDEVESLREFNPVDQRSQAKLDVLALYPVSEVTLDATSIKRFRKKYRDQFGAVTQADPLYEAVSQGRSYPGMEHWLPFFYDELESLLAFLPHSQIILDHQTMVAMAERDGLIADYYHARHTDFINAGASARGASGSGITDSEGAGLYKPCPPDALYMDKSTLMSKFKAHPVFMLNPFKADALNTAQQYDFGASPIADFSHARHNPDQNIYAALKDRLDSYQDYLTIIATFSTGARDRFATLLREFGVDNVITLSHWQEIPDLVPGQVALCVMELERGFQYKSLIFLTEQDILGERLARPRRKGKKGGDFIFEATALDIGDFVVHVEHGIGRYNGLETLDINGAPHDCMQVIYASDDRLYVPVENIEMLSRYGSEGVEAHLDRLGAAAWQARKAKTKARIRAIADKLIKIAAARMIKKGAVITPTAGLYDAFCAKFDYSETDDQLNAIDDVNHDLASGRPMDRLVCGDVGFGKTEVALRAAFLAVMAGFQVAVIVPTTLLARQHYQTFRKRFQDVPINMGQLSRLVKGKASKDVKTGLADGTLDLVIGTHALLSDSITFQNLGLLIVDEEQHFGVKQKERLKQLRANIHILTLTATPIPRTLQMALTGVRDLSLIATPPADRLAIRSFVLPYDGLVIKEAILREYQRGGQIFYVCPRLKDLDRVYDRLQQMLPNLKIAVAHGQIPAAQLEEVMQAFISGQVDILLATNIIESGLDITRANTMIVHRADMFGLSQLYQLRGRVGRSKIRAYCYFTIPAGRQLGKAAEKRLRVMQTLDKLGAGFTLASHDLDIRGAGNLVGEAQSGHVKEVGVELYQQMLQDAVEALKEAGTESGGHDEIEETWSPTISIGTAVLIPENYVTDLSVRLGLYRRLSGLATSAELDQFAVELADRFGPVPDEVLNLLQVVALKQICKNCGINRLDAGPRGIVLAFRGDRCANPPGLVTYLQKFEGRAKLRPDHKLVISYQTADAQQRMVAILKIMRKFASFITIPTKIPA